MGASKAVKKGRESVERIETDRTYSVIPSRFALHRSVLISTVTEPNRRNRDAIPRTRDCLASFIHASLTILSSLYSSLCSFF